MTTALKMAEIVPKILITMPITSTTTISSTPTISTTPTTSTSTSITEMINWETTTNMSRSWTTNRKRILATTFVLRRNWKEGRNPPSPLPLPLPSSSLLFLFPLPSSLGRGSLLRLSFRGETGEKVQLVLSEIMQLSSAEKLIYSLSYQTFMLSIACPVKL